MKECFNQSMNGRKFANGADLQLPCRASCQFLGALCHIFGLLHIHSKLSKQDG